MKRADPWSRCGLNGPRWLVGTEFEKEVPIASLSHESRFGVPSPGCQSLIVPSGRYFAKMFRVAPCDHLFPLGELRTEKRRQDLTCCHGWQLSRAFCWLLRMCWSRSNGLPAAHTEDHQTVSPLRYAVFSCIHLKQLRVVTSRLSVVEEGRHDVTIPRVGNARHVLEEEGIGTCF
jgi:hypothetical protein